MSKDIIILQHIDIETPGYILDLMNRLESFTETLRFTLIKVNVMIKKWPRHHLL